MLRTEEKFKIDELTALNLTLRRLNSVMDILILKRDLLLVLLFENTPMEGD